MFKIPILNFEKANVSIGDVYQFTFSIRKSSVPLLDSIKAKFAEYIVERADKFEVEHVYIDNDQLILQAKCIKNPLPFLAVFGLIVAGSSTLLFIFGLQLTKVHKIVSLPQTKILTYAGLVVALVVGFKTVFK